MTDLDRSVNASEVAARRRTWWEITFAVGVLLIPLIVAVLSATGRGAHDPDVGKIRGQPAGGLLSLGSTP